MKLSISGVLWGQEHLNGFTARDLSEQRERGIQGIVERLQHDTAEADADKQRAFDLLQRGKWRAKRNSEGLGE